MKNSELISKGNMSIRLLENTEKDMLFLLEWLTNPQVIRWVYEEGAPWNMNKVIEQFAEKTTEGASSIPCFIIYNGKEIGYLQYYPVKEASYKFESSLTFKKVEGGYGLDFFIGEPKMWDKGIGSQAIELIEDYLKNKIKAKILCVDPATDNERAIHFWQKVGFTLVEVIENYDDENKHSILMVKEL